MKCLRGLIKIDKSFKKDLKSYKTVLKKDHSTALGALEDIDGDSDGDSDLDAMVKESMKDANDMLKALS